MEDLTRIRLDHLDDPSRRVGATYVPGTGVHVRVWAPKISELSIQWIGGETVRLDAGDHGYYSGLFPDRRPGDRYFLVADGRRTPDPASRYQPEGVDGPSEVVGEEFEWTDGAWSGVPYDQWVIYELHVGTYSHRHDFEGVIDDLPRLKALGVTTLEIMPVSQFPGDRNWGYDGVFPHAVQNSYGGPIGLKKLVDACHRHGLAVILDVVYNHLGPEGNALYGLGHYTQPQYKTAWGDALNYDGEDSDHVRSYFLQAVWQWLTEYRLDGLRLDAIQMIFDRAPTPFLEEISRLRTAAEERIGRRLVLIGETDMNDPRVLAPVDSFGYGFDAQWADDFHHALHVILTGERDGYYQVYGGVEQLARIYDRGIAFEGQYSDFHKRRHGRNYGPIAKTRLIAETQNHDQIGNRLFGERMCVLVDDHRRRFAACCLLLSPFTPLLFMGQETGQKTPFLYFMSFLNDDLSAAVRKGRAEEWKAFGWKAEPPDPGAPETFERCVIDNDPAGLDEEQKSLSALYRTLIGYSKVIRTLPLRVDYDQDRQLITLSYGERYRVYLCFHETPQRIDGPGDGWRELLRSAPARSDDADIAVIDGFSALLVERG